MAVGSKRKRSRREKPGEKPREKPALVVVDGKKKQAHLELRKKSEWKENLGRRTFLSTFFLFPFLLLPQLVASFTAQGEPAAATTVDWSFLLSTEPRLCECAHRK
jgi:hypothetical protein